jgi:hypothetical protein
MKQKLLAMIIATISVAWARRQLDTTPNTFAEFNKAKSQHSVKKGPNVLDKQF